MNTVYKLLKSLRILSVFLLAACEIEGYFGSASSSLTILSPAASSVLSGTTNQSIVWSAPAPTFSGSELVDVEWSLDDGATWQSIVASTTNDGAHTWSLPEVQAAAVKIRLTTVDITGAPVQVESESFAISSACSSTTITNTLAAGYTGGAHKLWGEGTSLSPYEICEASQLLALSQTATAGDLSAHYEQTVNLDLAAFYAGGGAEFRIGTCTGACDAGSNDSPFLGTYDGGGFVIDGYEWSTAGTEIGLFGYVGTGGVLRDVHLENVNITNGTTTVGALAGQLIGATVTNSSAHGAISAAAAGYVGGLVGRSKTSAIQSSFANVTVAGSYDVAGLVAIVEDATNVIEDSYALGDVSGGFSVGGLVSTGRGVIRRTFAKGDVTVTTLGFQAVAGGLAGFYTGQSSTTQILDSYSTGAISVSGSCSTSCRVGGLVGYLSGTSVPIVDPATDTAHIENSYTTSSITLSAATQAYTGGIVGWMTFDALIRHSFSTGAISANHASTEVGRNAAFINADSYLHETYYYSGAACTNPAGSACTVNGTAEATLADFHSAATSPVYTPWDFSGGDTWVDSGTALPELWYE